MSIATRRSVPEWIGKTPDAKVPASVKLRVFERHDGICHISGRKILPGDKWEMEHVIPLRDGGEHRERNMRPALVQPHRRKTAQENKQRAKETRVRKQHLGIKSAPKRPIPGSKASGWKKPINGAGYRRDKS